MELVRKLNPGDTALIVIDVQRDFAAPDGWRAEHGGDLSQVPGMIENIKKLIEVAEEAGALTLYTQQVYDPAHLTALQKEQYELDGKLILCDPSTGGHELYKINPSRENVYVKYNYNAFSNREFRERLVENNIKTLIIVGMDTFYCVETAIRNGYDHGYKIIVPKDAVAANAKDREFHENTLKLVEKSYGVLTDTETIISIWSDK